MIRLPYPPTVNLYWRMFKGRMLLSKHGREYRQAVADAALERQHEKFGKARMDVEIHAYMPDKRRRDLDNILKGVLDGLAHAGLYEDDSQIDQLRVFRKGVDKDQPRVEVYLCESDWANQ